jgi:phenylacetate-coenzyme A ligase PaaK-like adenylate-forming protein
LLAYQRDRLRASLRYAVEISPYYRERIGALVAHDAPLSEFPILSKRELMANFESIVADPRLSRTVIEGHLAGSDPAAWLFDEYLVAATGGTTGERALISYDREAWLSVIANIVRFQRMLGVLPATRSLGIAAPSPIHLSNRFHSEIRAGKPGSPALYVTMPIEQVVEALNTYQPEVITTYPSMIRQLCDEQQAGRLRIRPTLFRSGAESLSPEVSGRVRDVWSVPVFNNYSSTEVGNIAQECLSGSGLHLAEDLSVYEVAGPDNRLQPAGRPGSKLLVTTLTNRSLPLVRYELTDIVSLADGPCACGSPLARLSIIEGRREDVLHFPRKGGGDVAIHAYRLRMPLVRTDGVQQFQFVRLPDGLEIEVSVERDANAGIVLTRIEETIRKTLESMDAAPSAVRVKLVDRIDRVGTGAKEKLVK